MSASQGENRSIAKPSPDEASAEKAMNNKQMSVEELVQQLKEGKEKGYFKGTLPTDPAKLRALAQAMHRELIYQHYGEGEVGSETGRQQLIVRREPSGEWDNTSDRRLPLFFEGPEWSALFRNVLHTLDRDQYSPSEAIEDWTERQRLQFQNSIVEYPMLARMWDTYIDVRYQPEEIRQLQDECRRVKASTSDAVALRGLNKLLDACDEALKSGCGLYLASD